MVSIRSTIISALIIAAITYSFIFYYFHDTLSSPSTISDNTVNSIAIEKLRKEYNDINAALNVIKENPHDITHPTVVKVLGNLTIESPGPVANVIELYIPLLLI
jgi:hypothetical protein